MSLTYGTHESCLFHMAHTSHVSYIWHTCVTSLTYVVYQVVVAVLLDNFFRAAAEIKIEEARALSLASRKQSDWYFFLMI